MESIVSVAKTVRRSMSRKSWSALGGNPARALSRPTLSGHGDIRFLMGPANFAAQGYIWSRALEKNIPGVRGMSMMIGENPYAFPTDYQVPLQLPEKALWTVRQRDWVQRNFTHVFIEAFRGLCDRTIPLVKEVELLQSAGIAVAIVAHGSEIRIPSQHADLYAHSPFKNVPSDMAEWVARLEKQAIRNVELARDLGVSMFVPTYDLFDFVPSAILNPNTIDVTQWTSDEPVLARDRPVVVFAPTKGWLKGSQYIDPVLQSLADEGLIDYRRIVGLPSAQVMSIIKEADVVIDSAGLGYYATTTVQAMAAGRLTIVHLDERVKGRLPGEFPGIALDDPTTLENTLREVLANRDVYRAVAAKAPAFASETHDGRVSSAALSTVWNA